MKSCPVALNNDIATVISAVEPACKPASNLSTVPVVGIAVANPEPDTPLMFTFGESSKSINANSAVLTIIGVPRFVFAPEGSNIISAVVVNAPVAFITCNSACPEIVFFTVAVTVVEPTVC